jgi:N-sulfoglucosamine sulfohydrolase
MKTKQIIIVLCCVLSINSKAQNKSKKPLNIVWLSTEDMGPILGSYGNKVIKTPNLDKLAKEGVRYTNAYSTVGVCAPSRFSIITGVYSARIGAHNMRTYRI